MAVNDEMKGPLLAIKLALAVIVGMFLVFGSWFIVSPGTVAIKTRMGTLVGSYGEGIHLKLPLLESVDKFSIQIERSDIKTEAFSRDLQTMTAHLAVNHRIQQETIASIYRNLGPNYVANILDPMVQEIFKSITAKYSAEMIIAERMVIVEALNKEAKARMAEKEIVVTDISIVDLAFSAEFLKAVEDKQIAEQQSKQAAKLVEKAKMDAEQWVAKARGEAEGLRLQREQVTPNMIELRKVEAQLKAIEKWNGVLPVYNTGAVPILNLGTVGTK